MKAVMFVGLVILGATIEGCSTLPEFKTPLNSEELRPRVSDVIVEIQCEILSAFQDLPADDKYVVNANLTLDVTKNEGVNPALTYVNPLSAAGTNFSASVSAQLAAQQHRNINQTFTLLIDKEGIEHASIACESPNRNHGLKGNLGIKEIVEVGRRYEDPSAYALKVLGLGRSFDNPITGSAALAPGFGSTIDFTVVYGMSGGPNWTLTHFAGPGGGSPAASSSSSSSGGGSSSSSSAAATGAPSGLLSYTRTNKDSLVISFSRAIKKQRVEGAVPADVAAVEAAGRAAQENVTRQILQRLLPP